MTTLVAIILAAGKGTRMGSDLPKVLHRMGDDPLVAFPIRAARALHAEQIVVVVGYQEALVREQVRAAFPELGDSLRFATQTEQLGTGHATMSALPQVDAEQGLALVLSGDVPLLLPQTLVRLRTACEESTAGLAMTSFVPDDPFGYGRVLRDDAGRAVGIREQRDASPQQQAITECNAGTYAARIEHLRADLPRVGRNNAQGEIYLTDLVALGAQRGDVACLQIDPVEAAGVNTPEQLAELEAIWRERGSAG
ncbi:MAG: NTP transferase domain-containing protein [Deltaproteobacteria bacterium]|nr:NTP transferase domain-containing protein [Deltaproteobacteria bacterium]